MGRFRSLALLSCAGIALAAPAWPAEIRVYPHGRHSYVQVTGELSVGDDAVFARKILDLDGAVVEFNSLGGNANAGIQIGRAIRLKGFLTLVPDGSLCASACALAWLGGRQLFKGPRALVGFQAGSAQAPVGSYLTSLGLPESAVVFVTRAPPTGMAWLDFEKAADVGIVVTRFDLARTPPQAAAAVDEPDAALTSVPASR